jgi:hypothetical protein
MARPKSHPSTADFDAQIAEVQAARDAEITRLLERRREAERVEHLRRGELLAAYLAGPYGPRIREALSPAVGPRERALFGMVRAPAEPG